MIKWHGIKYELLLERLSKALVEEKYNISMTHLKEFIYGIKDVAVISSSVQKEEEKFMTSHITHSFLFELKKEFIRIIKDNKKINRVVIIYAFYIKDSKFTLAYYTLPEDLKENHIWLNF